MFMRETAHALLGRLEEDRAFIQVITGPRQTGKTTATRQAVKARGLPSRYATADGLTVPPLTWLESEWSQARLLTRNNTPAVLVLDEVQKVYGWADVVKRLWDEDSWNSVPLHVIISGSSTLLLRKGCAESLAGRYEVIRSTHWSLSEMSEAFGYGLEDYLLFGGYPGASRLRADEERWQEYMRDSIIEATLSRDVLQMEEVRRPALMRSLFLLGTQYSAQELSYRKMLSQLDDKGNVSTLAHYLELLTTAGLLCGLQKYEAGDIASRASSPRLLAFDPSLMVATWQGSHESLLGIPENRGHLVESAVGAFLLARSAREGFRVRWWREGNLEVDFVLSKGEQLIAIEVKSGRVRQTGGLEVFLIRHPGCQSLVVGDVNTSVEDFLRGRVPLF